MAVILKIKIEAIERFASTFSIGTNEVKPYYLLVFHQPGEEEHQKVSIPKSIYDTVIEGRQYLATFKYDHTTYGKYFKIVKLEEVTDNEK